MPMTRPHRLPSNAICRAFTTVIQREIERVAIGRFFLFFTLNQQLIVVRNFVHKEDFIYLFYELKSEFSCMIGCFIHTIGNLKKMYAIINDAIGLLTSFEMAFV